MSRHHCLLLLLVLTRAEARLVQEFVWQMDATDVDKLVAVQAENPNAIACYIATKFEGWVDHKLATTSDSWFCLGLNFVKMASDYRLLCEGIRFGSSIVLELVLNRFTQVWCLLGKTKCLEMGLG